MLKSNKWRFGGEWLLAMLGGFLLGQLLIDVWLGPFGFFDYYMTNWIARPLITFIGLAWGEVVKNTAVQISVSLSGLTFYFWLEIIEGFAVGLIQMFVLRRWYSLNNVWILVTTISWGLGWLVSQKASWPLAEIFIDDRGSAWQAHIILGYTFFGALFGAVIGISQWLVLRQAVHQSGLWIVANVTFWTLAAFLGEIGVKPIFWMIAGDTPFAHSPKFLYEDVVINIFTMGLVGLTTGIVLFHLLSQPITTKLNAESK